LSLSLTVIRVTIEKGELKEGLQEVPKGDMCQGDNSPSQEEKGELKEGLQEVPKGDMCQGDNSPSQEEKMRDISALRQYSKRL
jgi:hypothetical protein